MCTGDGASGDFLTARKSFVQSLETVTEPCCELEVGDRVGFRFPGIWGAREEASHEATKLPQKSISEGEAP